MQNQGHELHLAQLEHAAAVFPGTSGSSVLFSHTGLPWPLHHAASSVLLWGIGWLPGPSKGLTWPLSLIKELRLSPFSQTPLSLPHSIDPSLTWELLTLLALSNQWT